MKTVLAFLWDAYKEATHTKMFQVLLVLIGVFLVGLLSIGFEEGSLQEALQGLLDDQGHGGKIGSVQERSRGMEGILFEGDLTFSDPGAYLPWAARHLAVQWQMDNSFFTEVGKPELTGQGSALKVKLEIQSLQGNQVHHTIELDRNSIDDAMRQVIRRNFEIAGVRDVSVESAGTEEEWVRTYQVKGAAHPFRLARGGKISVLFGLWEFRPPWGFGMALFVYMLEYIIFDWGACLVGVVCALIITAGMMPTMLRRGSIEFWLSKPVDRFKLVGFKFLGGLIFVAPLGLVLLGGSFLILSVRSGYWNGWFLISVGIFLLYYAVLHSVSIFFGMLTRSTVGAIFLTLLVWVVSWGAFEAKFRIHELEKADRPEAAVKALDALSYALPRTSETRQVTQFFMMKGLGIAAENLSPQKSPLEKFSLVESLVHCVLYSLLLLVLSAWIFQRRDF